VATLTIVNTANVGTTTPGGRIDYTITITNTGQTRYDQAIVTDDLSGVTDDSVAFGDDGATTTGSISYVSPNLTWTGDLEPGQSPIVTFSVTVNNPHHLRRRRQQLPRRVSRRPLYLHCHRSDPGADHHQDRQHHHHHHARLDRHLHRHRHRHRHRPHPLHRRHRHRPPRGRPVRRGL
jgi:uncharacterized repeat protein (TIGR01451 family)